MIYVSEYYERHLYGKSNCFSKGIEIEGSFDMFIFTVGWEERCMNIINHIGEKFILHEGLLLKFSEGLEDNTVKYEKTVRQFLKDKGIKNVTDLILDSIVLKKDIENNKHLSGLQRFFELQRYSEPKGINDLFDVVNSLYCKKRQPLNIGFDISSCPRVVFLQFLQYCISNDIAKTLSFFYSEGDYTLGDIKNREFTSGQWEIDIIPGYCGENISVKNKDYFIISFGFDQMSYQGWVDECETLKRVGILLPIPGYIPEYDDTVKERLERFKNRLLLGSDYLCEEASAGDAIEAWQKLESLLSDCDDLNVTFLPYGPKPHSLGIGLKCLLNENLILTYRTSTKGYNKIDVKPLGKIWKYEIRNLALF